LWANSWAPFWFALHALILRASPPPYAGGQIPASRPAQSPNGPRRIRSSPTTTPCTPRPRRRPKIPEASSTGRRQPPDEPENPLQRTGHQSHGISNQYRSFLFELSILEALRPQRGGQGLLCPLSRSSGHFKFLEHPCAGTSTWHQPAGKAGGHTLPTTPPSVFPGRATPERNTTRTPARR